MKYTSDGIKIEERECKSENIFLVSNIALKCHESMGDRNRNHIFLYKKSLFNKLLENSSNLELNVEENGKDSYIVDAKGLYEYKYQVVKLKIGREEYYQINNIESNDPNFPTNACNPNFANDLEPIYVSEERKRKLF